MMYEGFLHCEYLSGTVTISAEQRLKMEEKRKACGGEVFGTVSKNRAEKLNGIGNRKAIERRPRIRK